MVKFIYAESTYEIRSKILRNGKPLAFAKFEDDLKPGSFHLGYFENEELVCVASFAQKQPPEKFYLNSNLPYQLRGMAALESFQGKGFGKKIMQKAIAVLISIDCDLIWCNARSNAVQFYENQGFKKFGGKFNIPEIGEHYVMAKPLSDK